MSDQTPGSAVAWYRTPVAPMQMRALLERRDRLGLLQTLGFLAVIAGLGALTLYSVDRWPLGVVILLTFVNGTAYSFAANGVHELCHGTVFRTKFLNALFVRVLAFINWMNFEIFQLSHARHHRYTLHPPEDLEVVLPMKVLLKNFILEGFINPAGAYKTIRDTIRIARGRFVTPWELTLFPASEPAKRRRATGWARTLLCGHGAIVVISVYCKLWALPLVITFAPFIGGWLFFLCNNTQHIGLQDNVPDFRLCCRTFTVNPLVRFMYWHMNFHTEHHMYAAVPCYHLGRLHRLIRHDLPPCPHGLVATWREIALIQARQRENPGYQYVAPLPDHPVGK